MASEYRLRRPHPVLLVAAVVAVLLAPMSVLPADSAFGWNSLGCRWSTNAVQWYVPAPLSSGPTWTSAASSWSGVDATLNYNSSNPHIYATQENRGNTVVWTGVTRKKGTVQTAPVCTSGRWTRGQVEVVLNWTAISSYTSTQKRGVAAHEFGHALGLDHNSSLASSGPPPIPVALMYPYDNVRNTATITSPRTDDKNGINAIYP